MLCPCRLNCPYRLCKNYVGQVGFILSCFNYFYRSNIISLSILSHEKFIKVICIVYSFHLIKCALSNCALLLFRSIFLFYLASISHVSLCKYELGFTPNKIRLMSK